MKRTDEQLITDYLEGQERALGILVDRYLPDTYNFAFRLTGDRGSAEDIVQESFIKAWKNIRRFVPCNSFRGWLFTIVRNTAIDLLRQKRAVAISSFENETGENILAATVADFGPLPDELLARAQDEKYLISLLVEINPEYREVLTLRYSSNLTFKAIGEILKRPLYTVKSQHRRALAALRRLAEAS